MKHRETKNNVGTVVLSRPVCVMFSHIRGQGREQRRELLKSEYFLYLMKPHIYISRKLGKSKHTHKMKRTIQRTW